MKIGYSELQDVRLLAVALDTVFQRAHRDLSRKMPLHSIPACSVFKDLLRFFCCLIGGGFSLFVSKGCAYSTTSPDYFVG